MTRALTLLSPAEVAHLNDCVVESVASLEHYDSVLFTTNTDGVLCTYPRALLPHLPVGQRVLIVTDDTPHTHIWGRLKLQIADTYEEGAVLITGSIFYITESLFNSVRQQSDSVSDPNLVVQFISKLLESKIYPNDSSHYFSIQL